ncbi:hypothetical protein POM88_001457 [Heracleum sosnowskyi]|uniref:Uncharacterized protein n=1 Tax=Heracleum sosnowskyi TaxID=360622 RepID=A0AAD8NAF5_9APIA|nr:hypothetical protein POM88_001457 [Heracleum sosnowskyi]
MPCVPLLWINNVHVTGSFEHIFQELHGWRYCKLSCLPSDLNLKNVVMLDMYSKIMNVWLGFKIMNPSFCEFLEETPDFSEVINVEKLILQGCRRLAKLHPSIVHLFKLGFFDFGQCGNLTTYFSPFLSDAFATSSGQSHLTYPVGYGTLEEGRRLQVFHEGTYAPQFLLI